MTSSLLQQPMRSKNVCPYEARQLWRDSVARVCCNEKDGESGKRVWRECIATRSMARMAKECGENSLQREGWREWQKSVARSIDRVHSSNESNIPELKFGGGATLFPAEYADDVDFYLRQLERRSLLASDFLSRHKTVDGRMRQILVDWLVHVQVLSGLKFNLSVPYAVQFLHRYRFYTSPSMSVWAFAKFISEVANVCYALAHFPPSVVAAVSLNLAAFAYGCPLQSPELFVNVFRMSEAAVERISRSFVDHVI
ncbi:hypothetical protein niasHT_008569 [Heterodera trifolii]|uniref:Cyclin C-terminal domain-containing protein n=1 Tax=Heterodera trifolii TaxID=157864 RepID=A0ABD2M9Y6_9BILA